MTKPRITFDGITFTNEGQLWEFLKHQYYAHQSHIALLEKELDRAEEGKITRVRITEPFLTWLEEQLPFGFYDREGQDVDEVEEFAQQFVSMLHMTGGI